MKNNEYYAVNFITGAVKNTGYTKVTGSDNVALTVSVPADVPGGSIEVPVSNAGNQVADKKDINPIADSIKKAMVLDSVVPVKLNAYGKDGRFYSHYFKLYNNGKEGVVYKNYIIEPSYDKITSIYQDGYIQIIARKKGQWGMINENEEVKIPFEYSAVQLVSDEVFITSCKNKMGAVVLWRGNLANTVPCKYDYIKLARNLVTDYARFKVFYVRIKKSGGYTGQNGVPYFND